MVNSLKSFLEVETQKMLCCLPKNAWISGRASEAPGSERIERIVGTRMILETFNREGLASLQNGSGRSVRA